MRHAVLPFAGWLAALQSVAPAGSTADTTARLIGIAGVLGTLTVLVYRLGVWRQEMENTKHNVSAHVHACLARIERRLDAIDHVASIAAELLARLIHKASSRGAQDFVSVNCASLAPTLFEREMFGHVRGSFTDAKSSEPGLAEAADRGTLFLG